jgi:quercetin dioxygenase-like cupin family protein
MSARDARLLQPDLMDADARAAQEAPVAPSPELRESVLRSALGQDALASYARRFALLFDLADVRAREILALAANPEDAPWELTQLVEGARFLHFAGGPRHAAHDCGLVHVMPGVRFLEHEHGGDEWSLVLSGSAEEEDSGAVWLPGDLVHRPSGSRHAFRVTSAEPLVFAVILEAPIRVAAPSGAR